MSSIAVFYGGLPESMHLQLRVPQVGPAEGTTTSAGRAEFAVLARLDSRRTTWPTVEFPA
jgi:hypothetical protein